MRSKVEAFTNAVLDADTITDDELVFLNAAMEMALVALREGTDGGLSRRDIATIVLGAVGDLAGRQGVSPILLANFTAALNADLMIGAR